VASLSRLGPPKPNIGALPHTHAPSPTEARKRKRKRKDTDTDTSGGETTVERSDDEASLRGSQVKSR